jgi:uncharacterized membrane protein
MGVVRFRFALRRALAPIATVTLSAAVLAIVSYSAALVVVLVSVVAFLAFWFAEWLSSVVRRTRSSVEDDTTSEAGAPRRNGSRGIRFVVGLVAIIGALLVSVLAVLMTGPQFADPPVGIDDDAFYDDDLAVIDDDDLTVPFPTPDASPHDDDPVIPDPTPAPIPDLRPVRTIEQRVEIRQDVDVEHRFAVIEWIEIERREWVAEQIHIDGIVTPGDESSVRVTRDRSPPSSPPFTLDPQFQHIISIERTVDGYREGRGLHSVVIYPVELRFRYSAPPYQGFRDQIVRLDFMDANIALIAFPEERLLNTNWRAEERTGTGSHATFLGTFPRIDEPLAFQYLDRGYGRARLVLSPLVGFTSRSTWSLASLVAIAASMWRYRAPLGSAITYVMAPIRRLLRRHRQRGEERRQRLVDLLGSEADAEFHLRSQSRWHRLRAYLTRSTRRRGP